MEVALSFGWMVFVFWLIFRAHAKRDLLPVLQPAPTSETRYYVVLGFVVIMTRLSSNLVHGRIGRMWMAVRDMDIAAELMGIRLLPTKLLAFAVSSFYCGVAGALMVFLWYGGAEASAFGINQSFTILFMIIIGGLVSPVGSFLGAALIYILPIVLRLLPESLGLHQHADTVEHITYKTDNSPLPSTTVASTTAC